MGLLNKTKKVVHFYMGRYFALFVVPCFDVRFSFAFLMWNGISNFLHRAAYIFTMHFALCFFFRRDLSARLSFAGTKLIPSIIHHQSHHNLSSTTHPPAVYL